MSKSFLVYLLKDPRDGAVRYVGITSFSFAKRFREHLRCRRKSHKTNWISCLKKTGLVPVYEILISGLRAEEAFEEEILTIAFLRSRGHALTNVSNGGDAPMLGRKQTRNHIEKGRRARLGKKHSPETRAKMSMSAKGKPKSEEARKNMCKAAARRWEDPEQRERARSGATGRKQSFETIQKRVSHGVSEATKLKLSAACSGDLNGFYGKTHSDETRLKMREAWVRRREVLCGK